MKQKDAKYAKEKLNEESLGKLINVAEFVSSARVRRTLRGLSSCVGIIRRPSRKTSQRVNPEEPMKKPGPFGLGFWLFSVNESQSAYGRNLFLIPSLIVSSPPGLNRVSMPAFPASVSNPNPPLIVS